jgi:hypothetical protein
MVYVKAFVAGFLATLIFHQGVFALFYLAGAAPYPPFDMAPTAPFGVPAVVSLAFWGGVWGLPAWWLIRNAAAAAYWIRAVLFGAFAPSAVALFVVFPVKGLGVAGGWDPKIIVGALILNGAWGLGVALSMRLFGEK